MAATINLDWKGPKVRGNTRRATSEALEEVAALGVRHAHPMTPIRTGIARGSLRSHPAQLDNRGLFVRWGSFGTDYYIILEQGGRGRVGRHMLENASGAVYPKLGDAIRRRLGVFG